MTLLFVESPVYTEEIARLLPEEEQRKLQLAILGRPTRGDVIKGSGGLRKLRWAASGRGKSGGARVIYYLWHEDTVFMLMAYPKSKQVDLKPVQLRTLKKLIESYTDE